MSSFARSSGQGAQSASRSARRLVALAPLAFLCALVLCAGSARGQSAGSIAPAAAGPLAEAEPLPIQNVVVLIADDLGVDQLAAYGEGTDLPVTPVIDGLAAGGVLFQNAWSQPVCSPTRAGIFTGRHGFRTGIGHIVTTTSAALPLEELTLPELLDAEQTGYQHALIGKWHLGNASVGGVLSPDFAGWTKFDGSLFSFEPAPQAYDLWPRIVAGKLRISTRYATSAHVDASIKWVANQEGPWMLFLAFDAPHAPYHVPPAGLYYEDLTGVPIGALRPHYKAMVEAMDTEIGRLLDGIEATGAAAPMVVFVGDNGTPNEVVTAPLVSGKAKNTLYEGGINVPLIVSGRGGTPAGSTCGALVHTTDLFATLAELAGVDVASAYPAVTFDSVSFLALIEDPSGAPTRGHVYAERFTPVGVLPAQNHTRAVRNARYKLIDRPAWQELYDLVADPLEDTDLLLGELSGEQQLAYDALVALLATYGGG